MNNKDYAKYLREQVVEYGKLGVAVRDEPGKKVVWMF